MPLRCVFERTTVSRTARLCVCHEQSGGGYKHSRNPQASSHVSLREGSGLRMCDGPCRKPCLNKLLKRVGAFREGWSSRKAACALARTPFCWPPLLRVICRPKRVAQANAERTNTGQINAGRTIAGWTVAGRTVAGRKSSGLARQTLAPPLWPSLAAAAGPPCWALPCCAHTFAAWGLSVSVHWFWLRRVMPLFSACRTICILSALILRMEQHCQPCVFLRNCQTQWSQGQPVRPDIRRAWSNSGV